MMNNRDALRDTNKIIQKMLAHGKTGKALALCHMVALGIEMTGGGDPEEYLNGTPEAEEFYRLRAVCHALSKDS